MIDVKVDQFISLNDKELDMQMDSYRNFNCMYFGKIEISKKREIKCHVGFHPLPKEHPFLKLRKHDSAIFLKTKYAPTGFLVQGPSSRETKVIGIVGEIRKHL